MKPAGKANPVASKKAEKELLARARAGDQAAFTKLVRNLEGVVYRYAFKVCRDREKAEEAFQDTFVNMYRKLNQFDGRARLSTWLYRIVTNHCLMKFRSEKSQKAHVSYNDEIVNARVSLPSSREGRSPLDRVMDRELREALDNAIRKLPMSYRLVFVLRDLEGLSALETSKALNITVEATKSRLRRARAALRENLDPYVMT
ncbi:MAG: sigma-70 family RNA polymerase sigma factor [Ignavibacteria bacterium]|nr:sigma-70 family RNA polymerase sigma factor [Ignavibacteria bacterium]